MRNSTRKCFYLAFILNLLVSQARNADIIKCNPGDSVRAENGTMYLAYISEFTAGEACSKIQPKAFTTASSIKWVIENFKNRYSHNSNSLITNFNVLLIDMCRPSDLNLTDCKTIYGNIPLFITDDNTRSLNAANFSLQTLEGVGLDMQENGRLVTETSAKVFRNKPNFMEHFQVFLAIIEQLSWSHVQLVIGAVNEFDDDLLKNLYEIARSYSICIQTVYRLSEPLTETTAEIVTKKLNTEPLIRAVILLMGRQDVQILLESVGKEEVFTFFTLSSSQSNDNPAIRGSILTMPSSIGNIDTYDFQGFFIRQNPTNNNNSLFWEFWESLFNCSLGNFTDRCLENSLFATYAMEMEKDIFELSYLMRGVVQLLSGLATVVKDECENLTENLCVEHVMSNINTTLLRAIAHVQLGGVQQFDLKTMGPAYPKIAIYQYASLSGKRQYQRIGRYDSNGLQLDTDNFITPGRVGNSAPNSTCLPNGCQSCLLYRLEQIDIRKNRITSALQIFSFHFLEHSTTADVSDFVTKGRVNTGTTTSLSGYPGRSLTNRILSTSVATEPSATWQAQTSKYKSMSISLTVTVENSTALSSSAQKGATTNSPTTADRSASSYSYNNSNSTTLLSGINTEAQSNTQATKFSEASTISTVTSSQPAQILFSSDRSVTSKATTMEAELNNFSNATSVFGNFTTGSADLHDLTSELSHKTTKPTETTNGPTMAALVNLTKQTASSNIPSVARKATTDMGLTSSQSGSLSTAFSTTAATEFNWQSAEYVWTMRHDDWVTALVVVCGVLFLVALFLEIYFSCVFSKGKLGKISSTWIGHFLLCAIMLSSVILLFAFVPEANLVTCGLIRFGLGCSYALIYSGILVKILMMIKPNSLKVFATSRGMLHLCIVCLAVWGIQFAISVCWLIFRPPAMVTVNGKRKCMTTFTQQATMLIYSMFLLLLDTVLSIKLLFTPFKEGVWIHMACILNVIFWVTWVLVGTVSQNNELEDALLAWGLLACLLVILIFYFIPKMREIWERHEEARILRTWGIFARKPKSIVGSDSGVSGMSTKEHSPIEQVPEPTERTTEIITNTAITPDLIDSIPHPLYDQQPKTSKKPHKKQQKIDSKYASVPIRKPEPNRKVNQTRYLGTISNGTLSHAALERYKHPLRVQAVPLRVLDRHQTLYTSVPNLAIANQPITQTAEQTRASPIYQPALHPRVTYQAMPRFEPAYNINGRLYSVNNAAPVVRKAASTSGANRVLIRYSSTNHLSPIEFVNHVQEPALSHVSAPVTVSHVQPMIAHQAEETGFENQAKDPQTAVSKPHSSTASSISEINGTARYRLTSDLTGRHTRRSSNLDQYGEIAEESVTYHFQEPFNEN